MEVFKFGYTFDPVTEFPWRETKESKSLCLQILTSPSLITLPIFLHIQALLSSYIISLQYS